MWKSCGIAGLLAACSGGKDGVQPPTDTEPDVEDTSDIPEDSDPDGGSLDAAYWAVTARFAVDGASQQMVTLGDRTAGARPVELTVTLLSAEALTEGVTDRTSCSATFEIDTSQAPVTWSVDRGAWIAYPLPTDGEVHDLCQFYGLPGEFAGELAKHVRNFDWYIGLAPLDVDVEVQIRDQLPASEWDAIAPYIVGGGVASNLFGTDEYGPVWFGAGYGLGFEVDANFVLAENALGDPVPLDRALVWAGDQVGTGYYEVQVGIFDQPAAMTVPPAQ